MNDFETIVCSKPGGYRKPTPEMEAASRFTNETTSDGCADLGRRHRSQHSRPPAPFPVNLRSPSHVQFRWNMSSTLFSVRKHHSRLHKSWRIHRFEASHDTSARASDLGHFPSAFHWMLHVA